MNPNLLNKIADTINAKSNTFYAVVPRMKLEYMDVGGENLKKTFCYVLNVIRLNQHPSKKRHVWNIYENDIEKVIQKISQRDRLFADRITRCEPTTMDVEIIIRRASFRSLKLKIACTSLEL